MVAQLVLMIALCGLCKSLLVPSCGQKWLYALRIAHKAEVYQLAWRIMNISIVQHFCFFILIILRQNFVSCRSGYVSEVKHDSKFYCDASKKNVFKTASEMQCVHKCASFQHCQLLNYGAEVNEQENCEIFRLPHNHKSCKMLMGETNWKALVYKVCKLLLKFSIKPYFWYILSLLMHIT